MIVPDKTDTGRWEVMGIPALISDQVEAGDIVAFTMVYEPAEEERNRWRICAVKVVGVGVSAAASTGERS